MPDTATWTIIAAVAQIVAAIFAIIAFVQARMMLHQADLQRKESVAPAWVVQSAQFHCPYYAQSNSYYVDIPLHNTGNGPARNITVGFEPTNHNLPCKESTGLGNPANQNVVLVDQTYGVRLFWEPAKPLDGILSIICTSRFGQKSKQGFHVSTYVENQHNAFCKVEPV